MRPASNTPPHSEEGQIVVLFGVLLVALVAMVGLVLDGGSAFAQRRAEQNASDLAALTGANAYLLTGDTPSAQAAARANAAENGYEDGQGGVSVDVYVTIGNGVSVKVDIDAPHANNFGSIVGMPTWQVATSATALSGFPDTAEGAAPMIFNIDAFDPTTGDPLPQYANPGAPFGFEGKQGDSPDSPDGFTWTNYGTGNLNTNGVRNIIDGSDVITKTLEFGEYIGQHNQGSHTALFSEVQSHLAGQEVPVPIVNSDGLFQGWATFHITSASGGSTKKIFGYFVGDFVNQRLSIGAPSCGVDGCPAYLGSWVLALID